MGCWAAALSVKLKRLDDWNARRQWANLYRAFLPAIFIQRPLLSGAKRGQVLSLN